jgi:exosortase H (IPTLxxWG-CTERM-specific)
MASVLLAVFYALYLPFTQTGLFTTYLEALAQVSGAILNLWNQDVNVVGQAMSANGFSLKVVGGCDGLEATALFAAAVAGAPVAWRRRLWCLLLGIPILAAVNLLRIISLFYLGVYRPEWVDRLHMEVWPAVLIILVVSGWVLWARWAWKQEGFAT